MAIKPILFSTPMVQALLDGRKTMTRRTKGLEKVNENPDEWQFMSSIVSKFCGGADFENKLNGNMTFMNLPYAVGNILWVRETFTELVPEHFITTKYVYKANCDIESESIRQDYIKSGYPYKWKPSLFMPREAARIFLKVTDIKIERLQDISDEDAMKEGIRFVDSGLFNDVRYKDYLNEKSNWRSAITSFQSLWESINGLDSWDANPWVYAYTFERVEKPEGF